MSPHPEHDKLQVDSRLRVNRIFSYSKHSLFITLNFFKVNIGLIQTKDVPVTRNMFIATSKEVPAVYFQRTTRFADFPLLIYLILHAF